MGQNIGRQPILAAPGQENADIRKGTLNRIIDPKPSTIAEPPKVNHVNRISSFSKICRRLQYKIKHTSM